MTAHTASARPAVLSGGLAVVVAILTLGPLGASGAVHRGVALEAVGLFVVAVGLALARRGSRLPGVGLVAVGSTVSLAAVGVVVSGLPATSSLLQFLPAVVGIALVALAVAPLRGTGSRTLLKAGTGAVFASVLLVGLFRATGFGGLLLATTGCVVAWDLGEQAINVGEQLGRRATTVRLEVAHAGSTAVVGAVGVAASHLVRGTTTGGLSPPAFLLAFVALLLLVAGLRR